MTNPLFLVFDLIHKLLSLIGKNFDMVASGAGLFVMWFIPIALSNAIPFSQMNLWISTIVAIFFSINIMWWAYSREMRERDKDDEDSMFRSALAKKRSQPNYSKHFVIGMTWGICLQILLVMGVHIYQISSYY